MKSNLFRELQGLVSNMFLYKPTASELHNAPHYSSLQCILLEAVHTYSIMTTTKKKSPVRRTLIACVFTSPYWIRCFSLIAAVYVPDMITNMARQVKLEWEGSAFRMSPLGPMEQTISCAETKRPKLLKTFKPQHTGARKDNVNYNYKHWHKIRACYVKCQTAPFCQRVRRSWTEYFVCSQSSIRQIL